MKERLLDKLKDQILVCDGAMGTQLQAKGLGAGEHPAIWDVERPELVGDIHRSYIDVGADLITTNTFSAISLNFSRFGLEGDVRRINLAGARIAKDIAEDKAFVLGDIGPSGELLEPVGSLKVKNLYEVFKKQILALVEGGVDVLIIETMSDLEEAKAAVRAAKENSDLEVIGCMTFQKGKQGYRTMMGVSIQEAVRGLEDAGCDVVGSNCGVGSKEMIEIIREMRKLTELPLIALPNAGLPRLVEGKTVYDESPQDFARNILKLIEVGANIIGGCCGTTPQHIAEIVKVARR